MAEANPDLAGFLPPLGRKFSVYEAASGRYKELPLKRLPATAGCVVSVHLVRPILRDFQSKDLPSLPGVRSQLLQCFRGVGCGERPGEVGMPVRSQEPGPEVGRGLRPAAGREVGGAGAKVPAAAAANPGSLQPSCPTLPGRPRHTPPQLRFPVHLRGGHSSRRPPLRPARNKGGGGGDSCHRRRPPPRRGPDSPPPPAPPPAPRRSRSSPAARAHSPGPSGRRRRRGATRTAARPFTAPSAPPLQPPQRGLWRPSEDTWWEGRGGRGRGC